MKARSIHRCSECGSESPRWLGRCPECGAWGTLLAATVTVPARGVVGAVPRPMALPITDVESGGAEPVPTGVTELDRVLAGGLVPGSTTLLAGEPGMGKSTLLLQALLDVSRRGVRCLFVAAEESCEQVRRRAERLGRLPRDLLVVGETQLPFVVAQVEAVAPAVLAVDSIQALVDPDAAGGAGSVTQVRECAYRLVQLARERSMSTVMVGHVTKDGSLAGPRVLEHVVDTVLTFEGDRHHALRMLRSVKHRFGATHELGLFEMTGSGLAAVDDAASMFLADRRIGLSGSVVTPVLEGARPILVEVQALVAPSPAASPRRSAPSLDHGRLALLLAVLGQRAGVPVGHCDVYASVAGGLRVTEPGVDLAVALAVAGSLTDRIVIPGTVVFGEVGLGGEIRTAPQAPRRLAEAARLGFDRAVVPESSPQHPGIETVVVRDLAEAIALELR